MKSTQFGNFRAALQSIHWRLCVSAYLFEKARREKIRVSKVFEFIWKTNQQSLASESPELLGIFQDGATAASSRRVKDKKR